MKKVMLILILLVIVGCNESAQVPEPAPKYRPLNTLILPAPQNWKDAYGDTLETQLVFNAAVGGRDDKILQNGLIQTAGVIQNAHATDPNEAMWRESVEARLKRIEKDINIDEVLCIMACCPTCDDCWFPGGETEECKTYTVIELYCKKHDPSRMRR